MCNVEVVEPSVKILEGSQPYEEMLSLTEKAGRTCYQSEPKGGKKGAEEFVGRIISNGHESVVEHATIAVEITCSRVASHQIVRHRLSGFSQESMRYCTYNDALGIVLPPGISPSDKEDMIKGYKESYSSYLRLIRKGMLAENARYVLPNGAKTTIVMSANIRSWRQTIKTRIGLGVQPETRSIFISLLEQLQEEYPVFFEDIQIPS